MKGFGLDPLCGANGSLATSDGVHAPQVLRIAGSIAMQRGRKLAVVPVARQVWLRSIALTEQVMTCMRWPRACFDLPER